MFYIDLGDFKFEFLLSQLYGLVRYGKFESKFNFSPPTINYTISLILDFKCVLHEPLLVAVNPQFTPPSSLANLHLMNHHHQRNN